jgi:hypothetical protein
MAHILFEEIRDWMIVRDVNGDRVGIVNSVERARSAGAFGVPSGEQGYVHVDTGGAESNRDLFIPLEVFRNCTDDACYLNVPVGVIDRMGWERRPAGLG